MYNGLITGGAGVDAIDEGAGGGAIDEGVGGGAIDRGASGGTIDGGAGSGAVDRGAEGGKRNQACVLSRPVSSSFPAVTSEGQKSTNLVSGG